MVWKFGKTSQGVYTQSSPPFPPPHPHSAFILLPLWTCQPQSQTLINHWGWAPTLPGSALASQASSVTASAPGGWSPSCAPALAQGSVPAWHGCPHFTSQPCQPRIPLLPVLVCVSVCGAYSSFTLLDDLPLINKLPLCSSPQCVQSYLYFHPYFFAPHPS